jgi:hypothetical protein
MLAVRPYPTGKWSVPFYSLSFALYVEGVLIASLRSLCPARAPPRKIGQGHFQSLHRTPTLAILPRDGRPITKVKVRLSLCTRWRCMGLCGQTPFLNSALDACKWSASCPFRFAPGKRASDTQSRSGRFGEEKKLPCSGTRTTIPGTCSPRSRHQPTTLSRPAKSCFRKGNFAIYTKCIIQLRAFQQRIDN